MGAAHGRGGLDRHVPEPRLGGLAGRALQHHVFITFTLFPTRHGAALVAEPRRPSRAGGRKSGSTGSVRLTLFILISLSVAKFHEGGWLTLLVTGMLIAVAFAVKRHYLRTARELRRLE